jgi:hypothetical protein
MRTDIQLTPYHRRLNRSVICITVQHYTRVAVEASVRAILPEFRAVCVWVCDAEEGEDRDCEKELDHEEAVHEVGIAPVPGDEESRHGCRSSLVQSSPVGILKWSAFYYPSYWL